MLKIPLFCTNEQQKRWEENCVQYYYCEADAQLYLSAALDVHKTVGLYFSKTALGFGHHYAIVSSGQWITT